MKVDAANVTTISDQSKGSRAPHGSSFWAELISRAAEAADIDPRIAVLVASRESGLNPQAVNQQSGAVGIMQLLPTTAAGLGVNPHNVLENILGGVEFLHRQFTTFGDTAKALAAYNWGPHHVSNAIDRWGTSWLDHAPAETRQYVNSIISQASTSAPTGLNFHASLSAPDTVSPSPPARDGSSAEASTSAVAQLRILQTVFDAYLASGILS